MYISLVKNSIQLPALTFCSGFGHFKNISSVENFRLFDSFGPTTIEKKNTVNRSPCKYTVVCAFKKIKKNNNNKERKTKRYAFWITM